jgi:hypothetical protein
MKHYDKMDCFIYSGLCIAMMKKGTWEDIQKYNSGKDKLSDT